MAADGGGAPHSQACSHRALSTSGTRVDHNIKLGTHAQYPAGDAHHFYHWKYFYLLLTYNILAEKRTLTYICKHTWCIYLLSTHFLSWIHLGCTSGMPLFLFDSPIEKSQLLTLLSGLANYSVDHTRPHCCTLHCGIASQVSTRLQWH